MGNHAGILGRMGFRPGARPGGGPMSETMAGAGMAGFNRGMIEGGQGPGTGPPHPRRGRSNSEVCHILLLPTGLADGLGREVACPTALTQLPQMRIRPTNVGPPFLRLGFGEFGGWPPWPTSINVVFFTAASRKFIVAPGLGSFWHSSRRVRRDRIKPGSLIPDEPQG
jgi:hypothetical protein